MVRMFSMSKFVCVIVRILLNRQVERLGVNFGDKKLNMIFSVIFSVQNMVMVEFLCMFFCLLSYFILKVDKMEKIVVDKMGDMFVYNFSLMLLKEVWVILLLMNINW